MFQCKDIEVVIIFVINDQSSTGILHRINALKPIIASTRISICYLLLVFHSSDDIVIFTVQLILSFGFLYTETICAKTVSVKDSLIASIDLTCIDVRVYYFFLMKGSQEKESQ